ncbi:electron transfer flavoprotein beta subunit lysine methyltransferase isoform X2 [Stegostoma tigrinum]|uniref:electron transfer flavoprotein beta subunit lysine methyltransferase isoform X2 n=1 Tax=Stegostoma tigrinum TaxID=3053191 RepID=UPI00286FD98B|nr:electron transfer flavoprotein beta subunit lysine methyltransferase isoform X2 [Stegostoma tigrinum]XP_048404920.2 electron transfer flavoprotein beta subunit lysine methyltransferase isoform X2 [Stegostoma tigrinum]
MLLGRLSSTALCWRLSLRHPRRLSEPAAPELRAFIAGNTEPVRDHLTPEVCLRLLTPRCRFWSQPAHLWPFSDPYWAIYWPGGQALSRYLLDNPAVTRSKRVLDVGSGCGASAIAASMSGASHVLANDIDPRNRPTDQLHGVEIQKLPPDGITGITTPIRLQWFKRTAHQHLLQGQLGMSNKSWLASDAHIPRENKKSP